MSKRRVAIGCKFFDGLRTAIPPADPSADPSRALELVLGSFLELDISDGNVFYLTATCFRPQLMYKVRAAGRPLSAGQVSKRLLELAAVTGKVIRVASVSEDFPTDGPGAGPELQYTAEERSRIVRSTPMVVPSDWTNETQVHFISVLPRASSALKPLGPKPSREGEGHCTSYATAAGRSYVYKHTPFED